MKIEMLITQPESKTLEFKSDLSSLNPILKTIVAFANTAGGMMIIGRSPAGTIIGVNDIFKEEERLKNAIADAIYPTLLPEIEISTIQGKDLLIVKVAHWKGPFYIKKEGIPKGVYLRLGSTSRPAGAEFLSELQRSFSSQSFDQQPLLDLTQESLDLEKIEKIFESHGKEINKDKLCSLGVLVPYGRKLVPSIGGLILFGKSTILQQYMPDARVCCSRFLGNNKVNILDRYEVEGTILDAVELVPKFIARNTRLAAQIEEIYRKDVAEYPPIAMREVLINALVHNDYSIQGSCIQIAIYDNRLEIQNPGMLPFGFSLDDLKSGVSRIRNRVIARVFHELKLMEVWGSGYKRCIENCRLGNYPEPLWEELGAAVRVVFYPHQQTRLFVEETRAPIYKEYELMDRQLVLLNLFQPGEALPFREIAKKMIPSVPDRTLHYDLVKLRDKDLLISKGKGRAVIWQRKE